jgi:hypothetical protein
MVAWDGAKVKTRIGVTCMGSPPFYMAAGKSLPIEKKS